MPTPPLEVHNSASATGPGDMNADTLRNLLRGIPGDATIALVPTVGQRDAPGWTFTATWKGTPADVHVRGAGLEYLQPDAPSRRGGAGFETDGLGG